MRLKRSYAQNCRVIYREKFIRIIAFKGHINIEAEAMLEHKYLLQLFKNTPKGMLYS
jgi:hypothetical protein